MSSISKLELYDWDNRYRNNCNTLTYPDVTGVARFY